MYLREVARKQSNVKTPRQLLTPGKTKQTNKRLRKEM